MRRHILLTSAGLGMLLGVGRAELSNAAASVTFAGTQYDVGGTFYPGYNYPQSSIVNWRSDDSHNTFSNRHTATGRYYGVDGWALFGTSFQFVPDANSNPGNHDYLHINDPTFQNLEQVPYFLSSTQIVAHEMAGGDAAALIDDPRTQWGGRWWTFDGTNYPPPDGTNTTGVVPYLKTGFLHGWDEFGHDPTQKPAGRYAFTVGEHAPKRFRVGVMTDGLADVNRAPGEVFLLQMDPSDIFYNTVITGASTGTIPLDTPGGSITPGTNRFIDMHFFDITNAQPGDLFVVAAMTYPGQVYAGVNGISFDVLKDPGDYNADGIVDAADYTVWRDLYGQDMKAGERADGDNSSQVDAGDFDVWKSNFGHVTPGSGGGGIGGGTVPEPATATLMGVATLCGVFVFPRVRRRQV